METQIPQEAAGASPPSHEVGRGLNGAESLTPDLEIDWREWSAAGWNRLVGAAGPSSLEQSWAYGAALAETSGCQVRRGLVTRAGAPLALVQAFVKRLPLGLSIVRILRGPLWLGPAADRDEQRAAFELIAGSFGLRRGALLIWSPELPDAPESHSLLRSLGRRRMVTGASTSLLDLTLPAEELRRQLDGKWRNLLKAGEKADLAVRVTSGGQAFEWLVAAADQQRRRGGYFAPPGELVRAIAAALPDKGDILTLTALAKRQRVASILIFRHGACVTYCLGWSGEEGRRLRAHHLLLWRAILELQKRGVAWFDLGGVNAGAPGVARFKLGLGGRLHSLTGTYI